MIRDLLIGADIELFVQHKETGEVISAEHFIPGTKYEPFVFDPTSQYFSICKDNVLAEFCIPPVTNAEEFAAYIAKSRAYIDSITPKEYCTVAFPAFTLDDKWLQTEQARIFGCEPDFNAYTSRINVRRPVTNKNLRSAGLHVHFGFDSDKFVPYDPVEYKGKEEAYEPDEQRMQIIRACDLHLGIPGVLIEPPNERKLLYGKAGSFRPKPYGVEYRTLSNYYLASQQLIEWVYNNAKAAIDWLNAGNIVDANLGAVLEKTINNADAEMAQYIIQDFNIKAA